MHPFDRRINLFHVLLLLLAMDLPKMDGFPSHRYGHCNLCPNHPSPACWHNQRPTIPPLGWFATRILGLKQKAATVVKTNNIWGKIKEKVKPKPKPTPTPAPTPPPTPSEPPPTRPWKGAYSPTELWLICPEPEYDEEPVYFKYCMDGVCEVGCREERTKFTQADCSSVTVTTKGLRRQRMMVTIMCSLATRVKSTLTEFFIFGLVLYTLVTLFPEKYPANL